MQFTEELLWILDKQGIRRYAGLEYQQNIDFVHSLGLKCDCVGWSRLKLSDPRADEILSAIETFCREQGWKARGWYTRTYTQVESDWFVLNFSELKDATAVEREESVSDDGQVVPIPLLRAFHESNSAPKRWCDEMLVSEQFRNVCMDHHIPGAEFCWARDKGKYEAGQYFLLYGTQQIPRIAVDRLLCRASKKELEALGGYLPRIAELFYELQRIQLPDCFLAEDMPSGGIAYAYSPRTNSYCGRHTFLVHKDAAQFLLAEKVISPAALHPAAVLNEIPAGYILDATQPKPRPESAYISKALADYEKLKATKRPVRMVSEKEAVKLLRSAKRTRKEDFQKAMSKTGQEALDATPYAPLLGYYAVTNGGYLSEEYRFLPHAEAVAENARFQAELAAEELLEEKTNGIVIAGCPDGDRVLLCADGTVIRFSHEEPAATAQWPTLAQFISDAITDES